MANTLCTHTVVFTLILPSILGYNATSYITSLLDTYCPESDSCGAGNNNKTARRNSSLCLKCSCDTYCSLKGNCCPGTEGTQALLPGYDTKENIYSCVIPQQSIQYEETEILKNLGVLMVASCMDGLADDRCTNSNNSLSETLPQISATTGINYKNIYCGMCNNESNFIAWKPYVTCSHTNIVKADQLLFPTSVQVMYESAISLTGSRCGVEFRPPENTDISGDLCYETEWNRTCFTSDERLSEACKHLTVPYFHKQGNDTSVYANIFCFLCQTNGSVLDNAMQKSLQLLLTDNTFIGQLNYEDIRKHDWSELFLEVDDLIQRYARRPTLCDDYELYDPYEEECRPWYCPTGSAVVDGVCVPVILETEKATYQIKLNVTPDNDTAEVFQVHDKYNMTLDLLAAIFENDERIETKVIVIAESQTWEYFYVSALVYVVSSISDSVAGEFGFERFEQRYELPVTSNSFINLTVSLATSVKTEFLPFTHSDIVVVDLITYSAMKLVYMSSLADVKLLYNYPVIDKLSFCVQIALEKYEFLDFSDIVDIRKSDVRLYVGDFIRTPDKRKLRVCFTDYMRRAAEKLPYKDKPIYYSPQAILSVVCNLMSITGLIVTVLTYFIFGELRSIPGKNNMMLAIHLLIAQCFYQFGIEQNEIPQLCIAMGVFIHLFWLTSILWMNACTLHMFRTFVTGQSYRSYRAFDPQVCCYTLYCYSIAITIIATNIGVSMYKSDGKSVGYGGDVCYISTPEMVGWTFALPVGIIIILNMCFFFAVVYQISASTMRRRGKSNDRANTVIYMKLSTLTGVTWIFGYLYLWTDFVPLEYIFIVLNAGQGVLIFFSFICTSRILRLYNDLFRKLARSIRHGNCCVLCSGNEKAPDRNIKAIEMNVATHAHSKSNSTSRTQDTAVATSPQVNPIPVALPGGSVLIKPAKNGMVIIGSVIGDEHSENSKVNA